MNRIFAAVLVMLGCGLAGAQTVTVPNSSFEAGQDKPDGWKLTGEGRWLREGAGDGSHAIVASGIGKGNSAWQSGPVGLDANAVYRLKFLAKRLSGKGTATTGPLFANRDLTQLAEQWRPVESIFATPVNLSPAQLHLRFGQWEMNGAVAFDQVELCRAMPVHFREGALELGEGERLAPRTEHYEYSFDAPLGRESGNFSRPLHEYTCGFNSNRWVFSAGSHVIYRHSLLPRTHTDVTVTAGVTYHTSGELIVEWSANALAWHKLGVISKVETQTFKIPDANGDTRREVFVRLRAGAIGAKPGASFQVGSYSYRSIIPMLVGEQCLTGSPRAGWTRFFAVSVLDPRIKVEIDSIGSAMPGGENVIKGRIRRLADDTLKLRPVVSVNTDGYPPHLFPSETITEGREFALPYQIAGSGATSLTLTFGATSPFLATLSLQVHRLHDSRYGQCLPASNPNMGLWWCSSGWKVSQSRPMPPSTSKSDAIELKLAANERDAAQLVVRPGIVIRKFSARATELKGAGGTIPADQIDVLRVRYVEVTHPTDSTACVAPWPDPLPPFAQPIELAPNANQPLWIRVFAPRGTPAGEYTGKIVLTGENYSAEVPLRVQVYNFTLPDRMTCVTAFGFSPSEMFRYHGLTETADRRAVLEKYWANFAAHHIAPYDPAPMDPIKITWPRKDAKLEELTPTFDFSRWDQAMTRAMDQYHFNSFRLGLQGMGGGTFHHRVDPELQGFAQDTPQYKALMASYLKGFESHLKEKGWLDRAYIYWFDEPDKKDYEFVNNGFKKLKDYAPGLQRMLTEQVEDDLVGGPSIWCPVSDAYNHEKAEQRRKQGEKFWWYVCCGPKAPYCTLFIDHPGTELRVWLWQTWQRKIDGILVWQTNYWTSPTAFPDKDHPQNPYEDPMGWVTGYGTAKGAKRPWGNGDGRFIYPPESAASGRPGKPILEGPVDSIRWEMLRDGVEDYEYMAILRRLIAERTKGQAAAKRQAYERLLEVPGAVTQDMTTFTTDPAPIESQRDRIARAIEELIVK